MTPKLDEGQIKALRQLRNGNILCGGVGSGKSRTGLAYYFCKVGGGKINGKAHGLDQDQIPMTKPIDLYIITTAKKRDQHEWEWELSDFLLSTKPENCFYKDRIKVVVDSWNNIGKYVDVQNAFFLFDEQRVVGYGAWSKAFIRISKFNQWIFLTATPGDVWMDYLSIFIANGFFRNKTDFENRHVIYKRYTRYKQVEKYYDDFILANMRDSILVNIEYKNLAERHIMDVLVSYDRDYYHKIMETRWNFDEERPIQSISELAYLLRRVVNSDPSRVEEAIKISERHPRVIIFYNFDYELDILRNASWPKGTEAREYNGHKHEEIPDTERWVYFVQYAAGAEGWNCISTNALLFYSQSYSYKMTEQAMGRIDRRNTPYRDLYYYSFRTHAPIDVAISRALKRKKKFNESIFFKSHIS